MSYAELEVSVERMDDDECQVELRFTHPLSEAEIPPAKGRVPFDFAALLALQSDPHAYGESLSSQLFAAEDVLDLYSRSKVAVEASGVRLRLRLRVDLGSDELQGLRWELLQDPETGALLATSERVLLSRYMVSHDWRTVELRPRSDLVALIAVAAPEDLERFQLAPVDREAEIERARRVLVDGCAVSGGPAETEQSIEVRVLGDEEPLTLDALTAGLRQGADILYLVCHGALSRRQRGAVLYFQDTDGKAVPLAGRELAKRISELPEAPRLAVLASCESAAPALPESSPEATAFVPLAPLLAEAGVPAILAMQGKITMDTVARAMPVFFAELLRDGQIDRAAAVARGVIRHRPDSWMPALYLRLRGGKIWAEEQHEAVLAPRSKQSRSLVALVAFLILVAVTVATLGWRGMKPEPTVEPPVAAVKMRPAVAVLGLEDRRLDAATAWLSTAIPELVALHLDAGEQIRTVHGERVAQFSGGLSPGASENPRTRARLRQAFGTELVVGGSYDVEGSELKATLVLSDLATGDVQEEVALEGPLSELVASTAEAAGRLKDALNVASADEATQADYVALAMELVDLRSYYEGLGHLWSGDLTAARRQLESAATEAPGEALVHLALGRVWAQLGDRKQASAAYRLATELSGTLPERYQLVLEAEYRRATSDWARAAEIYSTLFERHPDDLDVGLRLVEAQRLLGSPEEAMATLAHLERLDAPASEDGRIVLAKADVYIDIGSFHDALAAAQAAARQGRTVGSPLAIADARFKEATVLRALGQYDVAITNLEQAIQVYRERGMELRLAQCLEDQALSNLTLGNLDASNALLQESLNIYRRSGHRSGVGRVLTAQASIFQDRGETELAEQLQHEALETLRQVGATSNVAGAIAHLGMQLHLRGALSAALEKYQEADALYVDLGDVSNSALLRTNIAEIYFLRGELDRALELHQEALDVHRAAGARSGEAYDLYRIGRVLAAQGQLDAAKDRYLQALTMQNSMGEEIYAAETRVALAALEIEQGEPAAGERAARAAMQILDANGVADLAGLARAVLARALLGQGKTGVARRAADQAWNTAEQGEDRLLRLRAARTLAQVRAAQGEVSEAVGSLEKVFADARAAGLVGLGLEAKLTLAEIEASAGRGSARLHGVQEEASKLGYGQIAARAAAAIESWDTF